MERIKAELKSDNDGIVVTILADVEKDENGNFGIVKTSWDDGKTWSYLSKLETNSDECVYVPTKYLDSEKYKKFKNSVDIRDFLMVSLGKEVE
jgi:hypothetical protein